MLGLSDVTRTSRVRSLTARELPIAVEGYLVYCTCPPVHVDIQEYKIQKTNVDQIKENLMKRKTSVWYKNILDEII